MDAERQRIQDDLRGLIAGEVRCDDVFLQMYASDASIYQIKPLGVVRPRHTGDVVGCVQYAAEHQLPVLARGAGTGLAGESLGRGLILDFSCHMRRILETGEDFVRVQPGVVHTLLNQHLALQRRQFGPDPAMSHVTTMGSVIAVDAAGSHWLKHGSARRHVRRLQVVLADGTTLDVGREKIPTVDHPDGNPRRRELVGNVAELLRNNRELIDERRPKSPVNRSGYALHDVLADDSVDLARLLVGSEGTLALITEATLATQSLPQASGVLMLFFDRLEHAARAVPEILSFGPSACDLMERRHLSLARESHDRYVKLIPVEAESVLLIEVEGESPDEVRAGLTRISDRIQRRRKLAFGGQQAMNPDDCRMCWQLARTFVPTLYRLKGSTRPLPFVEDVAIPPEVLPEFLHDVQNALKRHHVTASIFGHVGQGQLHIRPFLDLANPNHLKTMQVLAEELYRHVWDVGGTISGEHGDGLSRTPYLEAQYGPLYSVFREVKRIFDPHAIFNPGKVVGHNGQGLTSHLRPVTISPSLSPPEDAENGAPDSAKGGILPLQMGWQPEELALAARQCNGCGACRAQTGVRMCPIFHFAPREEASPRAKANLLRNVMTGDLDSSWLSHDELKKVADLCVHCHQCRLECPASVDIPRLVVETKAAYVRTNGLRPSDWLMARIDGLSRWASRFPGISNWVIRNRQARWLLQQVTGIAQSRKLPRVARRSFLRLATRRRWTRPIKRRGPKVLYFVDTYANHHDVQLAEALLRVFEHNGIQVFVHPRQRPAGMSLFAHGALDKARAVAAHNVAALADAVRQGYEIVTSEPSAALCLSHEYAQLLDDADSQVIAEHVHDAGQYLWNLHQQGKLKLDFQPLSASLAYHLPCHLKALENGTPGENLLRLIPGLVVQRVERGCSGMAGTFGLKRDNYRNSLRAGWGLISALRESDVQAGTTECSTCKIQMEQGTSKPTLHPLKILALAYGIMPEAAELLAAQGEDLTVT